MICNVKINNAPLDPERFIVARVSNGELWYWGSWSDRSAAEKAATQFENGIVVERKDE